jgi:hypothetical protein
MGGKPSTSVSKTQTQTAFRLLCRVCVCVRACVWTVVLVQLNVAPQERMEDRRYSWPLDEVSGELHASGALPLLT